MVYLFLFVFQIALLFSLSKKVQRSVSGLFYKITKSKKASAYLFAVLFLPGTYIHELSHLITSLILLVPVGKLELIPKLEGEQLKLGSVAIGKTGFIRRFIIGVAPLIFGISIILLLVNLLTIHRLIGGGLIYTVLVIYIIFTVSNTMFMSKRDMEGGWKLVLAFLFVFLLLYVAGFRATVTNNSFLYSENLKQILQTANLYLLFPLGIDVVIVLLAKLLKD